MKQVGLRLEEELVRQVKQQALNEGTSMQEIIRKAVIQYIDPKKAETFYYDVPIRLDAKQYAKLANHFNKQMKGANLTDE